MTAKNEELPDAGIITEMQMAYIDGINWPDAVQNYEGTTKTRRGMQNVLALLTRKGYTRTPAAKVDLEPSPDLENLTLEDDPCGLTPYFKIIRSAGVPEIEGKTEGVSFEGNGCYVFVSNDILDQIESLLTSKSGS